MSKENTIAIDIIEQDGRPRAILPEARLMLPQPNDVGQLNAKPEATQGKVPRELDTGFRWAAWGANDRLPTEIRLRIDKVPMAGQAIYKLVQMMWGNGISYYRNSDLAGGSKIQRAYIPEIEQFIKINRLRTHYLPAQFSDYRYTMNSFCEMIFSNDRKQIVRAYHKTAEFCRKTRQDEKTMRSEHLLYSPDFAETGLPDDTRIARIPLFQWEDEERWLADFKGPKFAWHSYFPTPGAIYYARPFWMGLFRENGWIDASIRVPEAVNALMKNQVVLKYQVLIPESYFKVRHQNWDSYTDEERNKIIDALIAKINNLLSGTENNYKSLVTLFKQNEITGEALGKVEIIAIDDRVKKDAWIPSSEKSDAQIVQGLGLHPSQVGLAPEGGKMGAGSGSDKRETYNIGISLNTIEQEILLEPLNFIARYNSASNKNWDITFFIDHTWHTTTNLQEDGMSPSDTTIEVSSPKS